MRDEVTVSMAASPEAVWALVADVTRIGEFSPETFEAEWLGKAKTNGPGVGAHFRGHVNRNQKGVIYWTLCKVVEYDEPHVFRFAVMVRGYPVNIWGYRITPTATGCDVTESFELNNNIILRLYWTIAGKFRGRTNVNGMRETLERIKAVVES